MKEDLNCEEYNKMEEIISEGLENIKEKCERVFAQDDAPKFFIYGLLKMVLFCVYDCTPNSADKLVSTLIKQTKERLKKEKENEL